MAEKNEYTLKNLMKMFVENDVKLFEEFIEKYGLNCTEKTDKRNLLMYCILQKKNEFAKILIEMGIDLNYQDSSGYSALHFAAQENNLEIITILIKNNIKIDLVDNNGNSALWRAAFNCKKIDREIIMELIKAGADIHKINNHGIAPEKFLGGII
jgi:ankyrin repeat protein